MNKMTKEMFDSTIKRVRKHGFMTIEGYNTTAFRKAICLELPINRISDAHKKKYLIELFDQLEDIIIAYTVNKNGKVIVFQNTEYVLAIIDFYDNKIPLLDKYYNDFSEKDMLMLNSVITVPFREYCYESMLFSKEDLEQINR